MAKVPWSKDVERYMQENLVDSGTPARLPRQEETMERSVEGKLEGKVGTAHAGDEPWLLVSIPDGFENLPARGSVVTITFPAQRKPHTCPGLERRCVVCLGVPDGTWDIEHIRDVGKYEEAYYPGAKHCPECGDCLE